ncbi:hypothetical protein BHM03_00009047 [Ensete ventricosum]|nr:hypothetical protein BHM03_00009047 [Ensete ventricosum]
MPGMAISFTERHNDEGTEANDLDLPLFDLGTVADATGNFSIENKLGEGGFGPVYKVGNRPSLAVYSFTNSAALNQKVAGFGVLVLEIISGKKNRGIYGSSRIFNLLGYTWSLWREGKGLDLVDEAIGDSYPMAEVLRCMKVALLCVQERPEDRPTMSAVVLMLGSDSQLLPQPRRPGFVAMRGPLEPGSSPSNQDSFSINNVGRTADLTQVRSAPPTCKHTPRCKDDKYGGGHYGMVEGTATCAHGPEPTSACSADSEAKRIY